MISGKTLRYRKLLIGLLGLGSQALFAANQPNQPTKVEAAPSAHVVEVMNSVDASLPVVPNDEIPEGVLPDAFAANALFAIRPIECNESALIAAINVANVTTTSAGTAIIQIPDNCTIILQNPVSANTGLPDIAGHVTIIGAGQNRSYIARDITSPDDFRIFRVDTGGTLVLRRLSVANGLRTPQNSRGGAVLVEDNAALILDRTTLEHNQAGSGGAIFIEPLGLVKTFGHTLFLTNTATSNTVAVRHGGGAILNRGSLFVFNSTFANNDTRRRGGAIRTRDNADTRVLWSVLNANTAAGDGGAFYVDDAGMLGVRFSKVFYNEAQGGNGGGIYTEDPVGNNVTVRFSRIVDNTPDNCFPINTILGCNG